MSATERDYVLGTDTAELERLGLQHQVWRPAVLDCWQRAGLTQGMRVIDLGCGPGYATTDLAEITGPSGYVLGVERSTRFLSAARSRAQAMGLEHVRFLEADVMTDELPAEEFDVAWIRWLACFVPSPQRLIQQLAACVRPGGVVIFHEYADYGAWRLAPRCHQVEEFTREVMDSWRENGGEPDIALALPALLEKSGFRVTSAKPQVFCIQPTDHMWKWPAAFLDVNVERLVQLGRVTPEWAAAVRSAFEQAETDTAVRMITPVVLQIIAERR